MIPLGIDLLSNGLKNHSFLMRFCEVFEQPDSSSFDFYGSGAQVSSSRGTGMNFS
jgi:hypothetical protein